MTRRARARASITISLCWILLLLAALFFGPGMVGVPPKDALISAPGERLLDSPAPLPSSPSPAR